MTHSPETKPNGVDVIDFPQRRARMTDAADADSAVIAVDSDDLSKIVGLSKDLLGFADADGYFRYLNPAWAETLHCPVSVLLSKPFIDFVHPDDRAETEKVYQQLLQGADCVDFINRYRAGDGRFKTLQWRARLGDNGRIYFSAREITQALEIQTERDSILKGLQDHAIYAETDHRGRITKVNREFCRISGYEEDELLGSTHAIVNSGYHGRDFFQSLWKTISTGSVWRGEIQNRTKSGAPYWVDTTIIPVSDNRGRVTRYVSIRHDITERKLIHERVDDKARLFGQVADVSGIGAWELDLTTEELHWDPRTREIHEVPDDYVPDLNSAIHFYAPEARPIISSVVETAMGTGEPWDIELPFITATGRNIWVRAVGRAILEKGEAIKLVGAFQEITVRKEHEIMLETMRNKAMRANAAKSNFLANMSHEIRTPLHGIMGMSQLLERTDLDDRQASYLSTIQQSGKTLVALINDVLDLSRIEAGLLKVRPDYVKVRQVCENVIASLKALAEERDLPVDLVIETGTPEEIFTDPGRLTQILTNFVSNALKFTETGRVELCVEPDAGQIRFCVRDTGIGIAESDQARIFERFSQVDDRLDRSFGGAGLGLSIAQELAHLMSGQVGLESKEGEGTVVWVTLPERFEAGANLPVSEDVDTADDAPAKRRVLDPHFGAGKRALVVDDVLTNQLVASALLKEYGFAADGVGSAQDALDYLDKREPDIIFMDLHMPGMSGDQCISRIRKRGGVFADLPIILLSADTSATAKRLAVAAGADAVCTKPFVADDLMAVCADHVGSN